VFLLISASQVARIVSVELPAPGSFWFFETVYCYAAQAGWNPQTSCLSLLNPVIPASDGAQELATG
jgi:hypothetical protein